MPAALGEVVLVDQESTDRDFSGTPTRMVVEHLRDRAQPGALERVLAESDDQRSLATLLDDGAWCSYPVFRRFLEAAARELGGVEQLKEVGRQTPLIPPSIAQHTELLQALGSPASLYETVAASGKGLTAIFDAWPDEVDETCWIVHHRAHAGSAPFPEYCAFVNGLMAMTPMLFGYAAGTVEETQCQCTGAVQCSFEIRWQPVNDVARRAEFFEKRTELLEARLVAIHATVNDLVSAHATEDVLQRIVVEAARAVPAPAYFLAINGRHSCEPEVYATGVDDDTALRLARQVLAADGSSEHLTVRVASSRSSYGYLCAVDPAPQRFFPQEIEILEAYGSLAAAALDSASALEEARRDATTARVMLELSTNLAEIGSVGEMAMRLARSVPAVVDCDRALVALIDPEVHRARVVASFGYPDSLAAELTTITFNVPALDSPAHGFHVFESNTADGLARELMTRTGTVATAMVPITVNGEYAGSVIVGVTDGAHRLRDDSMLAERLRGLAGQAATAVRNAALLDQIRHQALHDGLTGLPNRALILDRIDNMLARSRRNHAPAAVLFLDLDGFKAVNDALGHDIGDRLLEAVAARLSTTLRDGDTIGRLGGDEFVVLIESSDTEPGPELVADRLLEVMREPFDVGVDRPLPMTASIGIAVGDRLSGTELLRDADVAMYQAKATGKDRVVLFEAAMQAAVLDRNRTESDLRTALDRDEFFLVYQPIFDLRGPRVIGAEALLRWRHPTRGIVQPASFIPQLEDSGMIIEVGRWVMFEACREAAALRDRGHRLDMSVNVSARQLERDGIVADVRDAITAHAIDPHMLTIEITETTIMRDPAATAQRLHAMKALGVRVAIDDFGTGYSSLAYIREFPIDVLKIDRSFISAMAGSPEAEQLVHTLVKLGKSLGLETLAEGIEDQAQFAELQRDECDSGQGFLLARPLEPAALDAFLGAQTPTEALRR